MPPERAVDDHNHNTTVLYPERRIDILPPPNSHDDTLRSIPSLAHLQYRIIDTISTKIPINPHKALPMSHGLLSLFNMNSLNIITARVSPPPSPTHSRSNSLSIGASIQPDEEKSLDGSADKADGQENQPFSSEGRFSEKRYVDEERSFASEDTPLFCESKSDGKRSSWWHVMPRGIASSIISTIRWVFATLAAPGVYLFACFYDDYGKFAPMTQLGKLFGVHKGKLDLEDAYGATENNQASRNSRHLRVPSSSMSSTGTSSSGLSESEDEISVAKSQHGRSKSLQPTEETTIPGRRSIRIKLNNDEQRKHRKTQSASSRKPGEFGRDDLSAQLKSPTSPIAALTRYPKTPAPPRPLIPRRQPSYLNLLEPSHKPQKTLILDLDETLIHSMSKGGGRRNSGHMVEVRLNTATLGMSGQNNAAQHPILYWVNKRPYCDEFLRRVCKWFNLVIFTASVQEYADPVIDWLESERKFFSARYYRQHCTYRQGAYIKDLSFVEPDLSKVMILDNSPLSYLFHEDNAIPIQGWINDPTDNDLMHLVPMLEGLQYVHDVRALLGLRSGEEGQFQG